MGGFNRELVIDLILGGAEPEIAVLAGRSGLDDVLTKWVVVPHGELTNAPDPSCVAAHLRGNKNPTRQDIEQALDLCSR